MRWRMLILASLIPLFTSAADPKPKPYRLPAVDLKQDIIWGASATGGEFELFFGGQDQRSEDGLGHTRLYKNGQLIKTIEDLRRQNEKRDQIAADINQIADQLRIGLAYIQSHYFERTCDPSDPLFAAAMDSFARQTVHRLKSFTGDPIMGPDQVRRGYRWSTTAIWKSDQICNEADELFKARGRTISPGYLQRIVSLEQKIRDSALEFTSEPPPRALSTIVWSSSNKVFVMFGGDHLDYLTNDTWTFDPRSPAWTYRQTQTAPPPRANHTLRANPDGTITLSGGYTYASNTDYMGGQYVDLNDGEWTFDIARNTWSHPTEKVVAPTTRTYRTGPFHPDYFLDAPKPDPAAFKKFLDDLPANTWVKTNPPRLPQMNRDWGTAVIAPDRDLILRWAGGHSAHGGTDVLHFHLSTNRWELTHPVEFPLGQLYSNTSYPDGFNFNRRPWITGHTYQSYVYDEQSQKMLFLGRPGHMYFYDPAMGDWAGRTGKPAEMSYDSCYYTLTTTATPQGVFCWTRDGLLFVYEPAKTTWKKVELKGEKLAGSVVDNSTLTYEPKSQRLYFFRKPYGDKAAYDGKVQSVDVRSGTVTTHVPENAAAAVAVPYLCQIRCHPPTRLLIVGGTLPPDESGVRRTPAYDPVKNQWVSLKIVGDDPSGKSGRNVSLGLMWDAHRKLFWAVDAKSQVYVLRLEVEGAEVRGMDASLVRPPPQPSPGVPGAGAKARASR